MLHTTTRIECPTGTASAELLSPASGSSVGAVVIGYGSDGLTDDLNGPWKTMVMEYAEELVDAGFSVLVPDYLGFTSTNPGLTAMMAIPVERNRWLQVFDSSLDYASSLPVVGADRVGLLGFSLGGHLVLRSRSKAKVLVAFFAPTLDGIGAGGRLAHAQIHHGKVDQVPGTDFTNAILVETTLRSEGVATELHGYDGAGHGFIGNDVANTRARQLSKQRTLAFFRTHL